MANNINCTCGHSWSKASSSKKDIYVCHICGKDNTMKDGGWLNKFDQGGMILKQKTQDNYGKKPNPNEVEASVGPDFVGLGYDITGRNYSPAWGGQFAMGGSLPGAVGFTYARVAGSAPSNGKYAKKTKASAQNGKEMKFYQEGLDFKPNSIAQDGEAIVDPMGQWAHPGEVTIIPATDITMEGVDYPVLGISDTGDQQMMYPGEDYDFDGEYVTEYPMMKSGGWLSKYQDGGGLSRSNLEMMSALEKDIKNQKARSAQETISQYTPKPGDQERMNAAKDAYRKEQAKLLNRAASSKYAANAMENIVEPMLAIDMAMGAGKLAKPALEAAGKYLTEKTALKNTYKLNPFAFEPTNIGTELESKISKLKQQEVLAEESRKNLWADYKAGKITGEEYTIGAKKLNPTPFDNPRHKLEQQLREHKVKQDIINTPQQNILKSESQLGKNISDGGSNTKGVFELGDDYVARLSAHGYDDASRLVNYADKIKSPRIAKTLQVKEIDGKVYQVQEKATGTPITKLSKEDYKNIPKQHIDNFWKDKSELDKLGLSIDISGGKSNVFYDTKKGFQFIDLGIGKNESNKVISETLKLPKSNSGWLDKYK